MLFTRQVGRSAFSRIFLIVILAGVIHSVNADVPGESDYSLADVLFTQYRAVFRPVLGRRCVYYPSCSHYGQESIQRYGFLFGTMMALERLTRCHPDSRSSGEYALTPNGRAEDTVVQMEEVTCWGRSLLLF